MQLVSYNFETQPDNTLGISAQFVCLPAFVDINMASLRNGAPAPSALMASGEIMRLLQSVRAQDTPLVRSASAQTNYGLATISVRLGVTIPPATLVSGSGSLEVSVIKTAGGSSVDIIDESGGSSLSGTSGGTGATDGTSTQEQEAAKSTYEVTTSTDLKSLSGSVLVASENANYAFSFSYYAQTITIEGSTSAGEPNIGRPFGVRSSYSGFQSLITKFVSRTGRTYRNSLGVTKTQSTLSAMYLQTVFEIS